MNTGMNTLSNVKAKEEKKSHCVGFVSNALPEATKPALAESSQTGVSTKNGLPIITTNTNKEVPLIHWYALRVTYGREKKAHDYLVSKKIETFYPTITTVKIIDGKRKSVEESLLPNIFFARGTEEEIKSFVYDNVNLPYLRFYYRHFHKGTRLVKEPLIVPDCQMDSFRIICQSDADDILITTDTIPKFQTGQQVKIIGGQFKGVIGIVARYKGQQRVGLIINGLLTVITAYVPNAFVEPVNGSNTIKP